MLIYDDESKDGIDAALAPFIEAGFVELIRWPRFIADRNNQYLAYQHAVSCLRGKAFWIAMIDADEFGLGDWSLVDSGEQAMLAQVGRAARSEDWIVFLAWAPHPMNVEFDIAYLSGGDAYFGPNYGGAEVFTLARAGWPAECPNAAQLFRNLVFTIDMENEMMGLILDGEAPEDAAEAWLKDHPDVLGPWLEGVTTLEGEPGLPAVQAELGL